MGWNGMRVLGRHWPLTGALIVIGCAAQTPKPAAVSPARAAATAPTVTAPVATPIALTRDQRIANALIALNSGEVGAARVGLVETLAITPDDPTAKDLLRQIDTDPKVLLGERSFAYTIRRRESLATIAKRFLGDSNRFWALARYNGIAVPASAGAGRVIRVPGELAVPAPRPVRTTPAPVAAPVVEPKRVVAGPTASQIASAGRLRASGLDQMARGSIDKAVSLLSRAAALNPSDATIQSDLARALKVQATVRR